MAATWGFDVEFMEKVAPTALPGIRFAKQLKFHPLLYLHVVAGQASQSGARIFENTEISEFGGHPHHAMANDHRIDFDQVVIATHMPMQGNRSTAAATLFQAKLAAYSTYAIAATRREPIIRYPPSARTWAASFPGTTASPPGTAPATAPASPPMAASSLGPPRKASNPSPPPSEAPGNAEPQLGV